MDIEINEVQEVIKNLESGGELSIKEEKYLKVAKLCVQLAAENVALKRFVSGSCYVFDGDHDDDMPDEFVDASNYLPLTPLTDSYLFKVWTMDTPKEILEIIDSGDLETICYESERSYAEDFRLALYNFRQLREGADK